MSDNEREDLHGLIHSDGWQRLLSMARMRWAGDGYGRQIKLAIANAKADGGDVSAAVSAVDAASEAVNQMLTYPEDRIAALDKSVEQAAAADRGQLSRRGGL